MSFNKKFFATGGIVASSDAVCNTDSHDIFPSGVALYNLDYDASDASGNYDGTPSNVTFGVGGQINYGAKFNGTADASRSKITTSGLTTYNNFSISFWANPDDVNNTRLIMGTSQVFSTTSGFGVFFGLTGNGNLTWRVSNGGSTVDIEKSSISTGSFYHIVITQNISNNEKKLYVNGVLEATSTSSINATGQGYSLVFGGYNTSTNTPYDGKLDQVRIFESVLSQSQVDTLYDDEVACVHTATTTDNYFPLADGSSDAVAYYKFDNSAEDSVGTNDGSDTNIEYRFGRYGQAAVFNGSSSRITIPTSATTPIDFTSENFSISLWFKADSLHSGALIGKWSTSNGTGRALLLHTNSNGTFTLSERQSSSPFNLTTTSTYTADTWNHFVYVRNATQSILYLNTVSETDSRTNSINSGSTTELAIGYQTGGFKYFDGSIDQVRIFSTALDSDQVSQLYNEKPETDTSNFKAVLYEGNSSTNYISNVGIDLETNGGLVWVKRRNTATADHYLVDSVRGNGSSTYKNLSSNTANAEDTSTSKGITNDAFEANGFIMESNGARTNANGSDYVAWVWKAGGEVVPGTGTGVTNVSISANTGAGFSIVKYTGSGAAGMNFSHGLNSPPELVIIKNLDNSTNWQVFGGSLFTRMQLNQTGDDDGNLGITITSTTIQTTQTSGQEDNSAWNATDDYIAYCWHSVAGYSKIGTYDGTGSSSNNRIYTTNDGLSTGSGGFKPSWIMIKNVDSNFGWGIVDNRRLNSSDDVRTLFANTDVIEADISGHFDFNDDGFTIRDYGASWANHSDGDTYIYMAFK